MALSDTVVFNMGSLHGHMLVHPKYDLKVFISAIEQFSPDVIMTEVRPDFPGAINGSIDGGIEQSIIYAIAEMKNIDVIPIDWFDDELISVRDQEMRRSSDDARVAENVVPIFNLYVEKFKTESFEELHSDETSALVKSFYDLYEEYGYNSSKVRNDNICANFRSEISKLSGKRILTIFGLDHKYALDDCSLSQEVQTLKVDQWYKEDQTFSINPLLIERSLDNLKDSKSELQSRISGGYYSVEYTEQIRPKFEGFDRWIKTVSDLL